MRRPELLRGRWRPDGTHGTRRPARLRCTAARSPALSHPHGRFRSTPRRAPGARGPAARARRHHSRKDPYMRTTTFVRVVSLSLAMAVGAMAGVAGAADNDGL